MGDHIECWLLLVDILGLLSCGGQPGCAVHGCVGGFNSPTPRAVRGTVPADGEAKVASHATPGTAVPVDGEDHLVLRD